jgi:protein SCO1/2
MMRIDNTFQRCGVALGLLLACAAWSAPGTAVTPPAAQAKNVALPSDSVYQLAVPLTDQAGRRFTLGERRGSPTIVSMFYTSCQFVCPMLVDGIRSTQNQLSEAERARVNVLMVSFDPQHDTTAVLKKTAAERQLDAATWTLARTDATHVRKLAAVLGVQYKALPNGDFNHTTALILVDGAGRIVGRTTQLGDADPNFVKLVKSTLASASH